MGIPLHYEAKYIHHFLNPETSWITDIMIFLTKYLSHLKCVKKQIQVMSLPAHGLNLQAILPQKSPEIEWLLKLIEKHQ